jgi:spore maturation protein CgeB
MKRNLVKTLKRWDSDLVVVVKAELIEPDTLKKLKGKGFQIALLANDDHQVLSTASLPLGRHCDRVFTFTKWTLPAYEKAGIPAEHMLFYADPQVCAPRPEKPEESYDACFVGTYYPEREDLVVALARSGLNFELMGDGWNDTVVAEYGNGLPSDASYHYGGRADYPDVLRAWQGSKVCVNIHQDGLKRLGVVANLRCYELGAAGCFMATDYLPGMQEAFGNPVPFKILPEDWSPEEKASAVKSSAGPEHAEMRREKAAALCKIVLERHTPDKRCLQILNALKIGGTGWT